MTTARWAGSGALVVVAASAAFVQWWSDRWEMTGLLVVSSLFVLGAALAIRQNRSVHRLLHLQRRRLRAVQRAAERFEAAQLVASTSFQADNHRRQADRHHKDLKQGHRQLGEGQRELSIQLASLATEMRARREVEDARSEATAKVWAHLEAGFPLASTAAAEAAIPPAVAPQMSVPAEDLLSGLRADAQLPSVVLVLDSFTPTQIFAGVRTALLVGLQSATELGRPLRVIVMREPKVSVEDARTVLQDWISSEIGSTGVAPAVLLETPSERRTDRFHHDDLWIATYWATAVAVARACDEGLTRPSNVIYLVQDWEPGFFSWGTEYALAESTYHRGFRLLINSTPLAEYVQGQTGIEVPTDSVFAPLLDEARLRRAAALWKPVDPTRPRLLFYARPSKPRNLCALGLAALRIWADSLPSHVRPEVTLAGENVDAIDLGDRVDVILAGKLGLDDYYRLLEKSDMALALMHSPHPSHLPLELPMAGIPTVTNKLGSSRTAWVQGLVVCDCTPHSIAEGLKVIYEEASRMRVHAAHPLPESLGYPFTVALKSVLTAKRDGRA